MVVMALFTIFGLPCENEQDDSRRKGMGCASDCGYPPTVPLARSVTVYLLTGTGTWQIHRVHCVRRDTQPVHGARPFCKWSFWHAGGYWSAPACAVEGSDALRQKNIHLLVYLSTFRKIEGCFAPH